MNFEFSKNLQGFEAVQNVDLSRVKFQTDPVLLCTCKESGETPGIKRPINLPNISQYVLRITGLANNDRSYVILLDEKGIKLTERIYLKNREKTTLNTKFYPRSQKVILGIFMGGDSIAVPGNYFMIMNIKLSPLKKILPQNIDNSSIKITRTFETVEELEKETQDPLRSNKSPMTIGEYAILQGNSNNNTDNNTDTDTDTLATTHHDDLYILSTTGLKYVCRIGAGLPTFFGEAMHQVPGKVMPVYPDEETALQDFQKQPENFYQPKGKYEWNNLRNNIKTDIYMYLDTQGYVRWLRH